MPTHKSAHQKALIRIGEALTHLYNAVYTTPEAYTRADAMLCLLYTSDAADD